MVALLRLSILIMVLSYTARCSDYCELFSYYMTVPQLCPRVFNFVPQLCLNCASNVPM